MAWSEWKKFGSDLQGKQAISRILALTTNYVIIPTCGHEIKVTFFNGENYMAYWGSNIGAKDDNNDIVSLTKNTTTGIVTNSNQYEFLIIGAYDNSSGGATVKFLYEWI